VSPERRERLASAIMRIANLVPCAHHVDPRVLDAQVKAMTDEDLSETIRAVEFIVDSALGTDV